MNGQSKNAEHRYIQTCTKTLCLVLALLITVCLLPSVRVYAAIPQGGTGDYIAADNTARWALYQDGRLVINVEGTTAMPELAQADYGWHAYRSDITEIVVESGITTVSGYAFKDCANAVSVTIADITTRSEPTAQ